LNQEIIFQAFSKVALFIGFDNIGGQPVAAYNDAELADDGQIVHSVDGVVRAIIQPEGWTEYAVVWPGGH
jgi:hypothetical protein